MIQSLQQTICGKFGRCYTIVPLWRVGSTYPAPASFGAHGSCGQRPDDHRGQMESPESCLDSGESLGSESPEGWRRAPELLCKPNARGQSVAEGNKLDGTPIGKRTLTRLFFLAPLCAESLWSMDGIAPNLTRPWEGQDTTVRSAPRVQG